MESMRMHELFGLSEKEADIINNEICHLKIDAKDMTELINNVLNKTPVDGATALRLVFLGREIERNEGKGNLQALLLKLGGG